MGRFTNFVNYVHKLQPKEYDKTMAAERTFVATQSSSSAQLSLSIRFIYDKKALEIYGWLKYIIPNLYAFHVLRIMR